MTISRWSAISGDRGGRVYEDLMDGLEDGLAIYSFLDSTRMATVCACRAAGT